MHRCMRWRRSHHLVAVFVVLPFLFSEESDVQGEEDGSWKKREDEV
jgi:hypothetical protein